MTGNSCPHGGESDLDFLAPQLNISRKFIGSAGVRAHRWASGGGSRENQDTLASLRGQRACQGHGSVGVRISLRMHDSGDFERFPSARGHPRGRCCCHLSSRCVQPTRESLGWGLPEGGGRCDTLPGHAQPPPWAPHVTSPLSFTPPPLVYLPRPEGCLCRFFLRSEQGRGLTFQTVWLMVPFPSSLSSTFGPARVRTFSQVWTPPCL